MFNKIWPLRPFFERTVPAHGNQHTPTVAVPNTFRGEFYSYHSGNFKLSFYKFIMKRAIFDMNYTADSYYIIDSGISGNIFSEHYDD